MDPSASPLGYNRSVDSLPESTEFSVSRTSEIPLDDGTVADADAQYHSFPNETPVKDSSVPTLILNTTQSSSWDDLEVPTDEEQEDAARLLDSSISDVSSSCSTVEGVPLFEDHPSNLGRPPIFRRRASLHPPPEFEYERPNLPSLERSTFRHCRRRLVLMLGAYLFLATFNGASSRPQLRKRPLVHEVNLSRSREEALVDLPKFSLPNIPPAPTTGNHRRPALAHVRYQEKPIFFSTKFYMPEEPPEAEPATFWGSNLAWAFVLVLFLETAVQHVRRRLLFRNSRIMR